MEEIHEEYKRKFREALESAIRSFGLEPLTEAQFNRLNAHYSMMLDWNRHINLTRITAPDQAARLHYAESLFGGRFIGDISNVLDIGSGAGFPSVPMAVIRSDIRMSALDHNQKKALFLNEVKDALGLNNFFVLRSRIEDFDLRNFDLITSRALDNADKVLASVAARLKPPQRLMLFCAPDLAEKITGRLGNLYKAEIQPIPHTENRQVALFSPV